jgi:hypothetical protein
MTVSRQPETYDSFLDSLKPLSHMFTVVDLWFNASHGSVHANVFFMKGSRFVVDTLNFCSFDYGDILFKMDH